MFNLNLSAVRQALDRRRYNVAGLFFQVSSFFKDNIGHFVSYRKVLYFQRVIF